MGEQFQTSPVQAQLVISQQANCAQPPAPLVPHPQQQQHRLHSLLFMSMEGDPGLAGPVHQPRLVANGSYHTSFRHNRQRFIIDSGATLAMTLHTEVISEPIAYDTDIMIADSSVVISVVMERMGAFTGVRVIGDAPIIALPISALANARQPRHE